MSFGETWHFIASLSHRSSSVDRIEQRWCLKSPGFIGLTNVGSIIANDLFIILFWFRPDLNIPVVIEVHVDRVRTTANRTVLDVRLTCAFG